MPNHWHFVLWPEEDGELTRFMRWLTHTHTMRWHAHHRTSGTGHLYQGRFKSFPVQDDDHYFTLVRYVEQNALRAGLVDRANHWRWSSLWRRHHGDQNSRALLHAWPLPTPDNWLEKVNRIQPKSQTEAIRHSIKKSCPFGGSQWVTQAAIRLGIESTLRPRGRPRKK